MVDLGLTEVWKHYICKCHICGKERPDGKINVLSKPGGPGLTQNIRYCNDDPDCIKGAETFSFFKEEEDDCAFCGGKGKLPKYDYTGEKLFLWHKCGFCNGTGKAKVEVMACPECGGMEVDPNVGFYGDGGRDYDPTCAKCGYPWGDDWVVKQ